MSADTPVDAADTPGKPTGESKTGEKGKSGGTRYSSSRKITVDKLVCVVCWEDETDDPIPPGLWPGYCLEHVFTDSGD